jgi:hypothetical protein
MRWKLIIFVRPEQISSAAAVEQSTIRWAFVCSGLEPLTHDWWSLSHGNGWENGLDTASAVVIFFYHKGHMAPSFIEEIRVTVNKRSKPYYDTNKKVPWVHGKSKTKKIMQLHHQTAPLSPFKASSIVIFLVSGSTQLFRVHKWRRWSQHQLLQILFALGS